MSQPHVPVLLAPLLAAVAPVQGTWIDATFGAGGYSRGLLDAGAERIIAIDRDPSVAPHAAALGPRVTLHTATFADMDAIAGEAAADGVVMDLGVSSMQLDEAERGFSFLRDGPLDMRMGDGPSAADLLDAASEAEIADVLHAYGEERAARRIARAIVAARPLHRTAALADVIARQLPRPKPGQAHPATRSFQAIRIWVNDEFGQLAAGLGAAERALKPGGRLAVVSFHSLEDRVVKRFLAERSGTAPGTSRHAPDPVRQPPAFRLPRRAGITATEAELSANPRARSATLRVAVRTDAPAGPADPARLGLPRLRVPA